MSGDAPRPGPLMVVERLRDATNTHDLEGIVASFADDYRNETPAHPARGFQGRDQVRRNWTQILGGVPDIVTSILAVSVTADTVWSEWEMRGVRRDGAPHLLRGVIVFRVANGLIAHGRFFLEPVTDSGGPDEAVAASVQPSASP